MSAPLHRGRRQKQDVSALHIILESVSPFNLGYSLTETQRVMRRRYHREILTAKEVEAFLRIDVKTIYSYVQRGLIPHMRIESNVRFSKHQVLEWLRERNFQPRPVNQNGAKRQ